MELDVSMPVSNLPDQMDERKTQLAAAQFNQLPSHSRGPPKGASAGQPPIAFQHSQVKQIAGYIIDNIRSQPKKALLPCREEQSLGHSTGYQPSTSPDLNALETSCGGSVNFLDRKRAA